jgi:hypothetical protein
MTLNELIAQCKAENPTMTQTINGVEVELLGADYENAVTNWAKMRVEQLDPNFVPPVSKLPSAEVLTPKVNSK